MPEELIRAFKKDEALIREIDSLVNEQDHFYLWWLGQSGFLLQWQGQRVLIDPYLSDSLTKKYAGSDKPHIRMSERVIDPALLRQISIVSSSHNHTDHLDGETLITVLKNNPGIKFIIPEANRDFVAERVNCSKEFPVGLRQGEAVNLGQFVFQGIPASHNKIELDGKGNCRFMGYVISFGKFKIYHSGDTIWFEGMEELLRPFRVDVALLPINGNEASRKVAGNLNVKEAAKLGKEIEAKFVVPCHYDMFTFNTADVNDFIREAGEIGQPFTVLRGGERFTGN